MQHTRKMMLVPADNYRASVQYPVQTPPTIHASSQIIKHGTPEFQTQILQSQQQTVPLVQENGFTVQTPGNKFTRMDQEMSNILESDLSDVEKWKKYEQVLSRFLFHINTPKNNQKTIGNIEESAEPMEQDGEDSLQTGEIPLEKEIIDSLTNEMYRQKGRLLMDFLRHPNRNSIISWNSTGSLILKDVTHRRTNIIDFINDVIRKRTTFSAFDKNKIAKIFNYLGVPREYIGNKSLLAALDSQNNRSDSSLNLSQSKSGYTSADNSSYNSFEKTVMKTPDPYSGKKSGKTSTPIPSKTVQTGKGWLTLTL